MLNLLFSCTIFEVVILFSTGHHEGQGVWPCVHCCWLIAEAHSDAPPCCFVDGSSSNPCITSHFLTVEEKEDEAFEAQAQEAEGKVEDAIGSSLACHFA